MKEIIDFKIKDRGEDNLIHKKHSHAASYEILFVHSGGGSIIVRDHIFPIIKGGIYFINGMETHCSVPETADEYCRDKIVISAEFVDGIARIMECETLVKDLFLLQGGICIAANEQTAQYIEKEFLNLLEDLDNDCVYTKMRVASALMNIFFCAHSNICNQKNSKNYNSSVSGILKYINENLAKKITLDDICKNEHISRYYLCHIFKKAVGVTVFEYILSRRLSLSKKYLLSTDLPVSQIAEMSGFSSFSYFGKMFKEDMGCTPAKFRAENKKVAFGN